MIVCINHTWQGVRVGEAFRNSTKSCGLLRAALLAMLIDRLRSAIILKLLDGRKHEVLG